MNSKQIVLVGLVLTSLITSLASFEVLPGLVMAVLILGGGIMATYYMALSKMRLERMAEMTLLLKSGKALYGQTRETEIIKQLAYWVERLVPCECAFVLWKDNIPADNESINNWPGWEELKGWIKEQKKALLLNKTDQAQFKHALPGNIESLIGLPLIIAEDVPGILFLVNKKNKEYFRQQEQDFLEIMCQQAALALSRTNSVQDLQDFDQEIIVILTGAIDSSYPGFAGHSRRVAEISLLLAEKMGLDDEEIKVVHYSALLHDIGKIALLKTDSIDGNEEHEELTMEHHPVLGAEMLPDDGIWDQIKSGILYHHERYDGSGFPEGLSMTDIPIPARIIAVADVYDAITRLCPAEERMEHEAAVKEIKKVMGSLLDPLVVVVLEEIKDQVKEIDGGQ